MLLLSQEQATSKKTMSAATETTTTMMPLKTFQQLQLKVGSLMFPEDLHNSTHYVDCVALKKHLIKEKIWSGGAKKIAAVLVQTTSHPEFKNIQNKDIPYKSAIAAHPTQDGAYQTTKYGIEAFVSDHPVGDVIVVYN